MPAGGIALVRINILDSNRCEGGGSVLLFQRMDLKQGRLTEVDVVQIEVLKTPPFQRLLSDRDDALAIMEGVPELRDNKKILALDDTIVDSTLHTLAGFLLVSIVW